MSELTDRPALDLDGERPMRPGALICIRVALAFAAGVGLDLILGGDAYPYGERFQHQYLIGINVVWLDLLFAFLCSLALCFNRRPLRGENRTLAPWLAEFDSSGLLIPLAMVVGVSIAHTIVLIRDVTIDPTTHNLLPFEYIIAWIIVGLPALAGSMLARAMSWALNRVRVQ